MSDLKTFFLTLLGAIRTTNARASGEQINDFGPFTHTMRITGMASTQVRFSEHLSDEKLF